MSWANFAWDLEDEEDEPDITLPSWGKTKANDPVPSAPVQKTVKRLKNAFAQKQELVEQEASIEPPVPADPAPSSQSSAQDEMMLEFPSLDVYRTSSPVASEPKKNRVSFAEQQELVEQEASIETPVPADPAPPSEEPTIKDPQNVENDMDKPEDPDVSSTPPAVSKRKKKSRRARAAICIPQDQKMRTELETDSNTENMCMLEERQQLPPEPPVTPTPDPESEHSASDVSITSPGASDGKTKKKKRVSFAENVELVEQEASIETPVPADPTPQSEEPTIKDPQNVENNMDNPEDPDVSSTRPVVSKKRKKKSRRGRNTFCSPEEQEMRTELETDSNIENMCMLEERQQLPPEPPVTPTPDPEPEHSASDVSITSPGASDGKTKKKKRVSFAENVELVEQEASIETPVPADPTPQSEEPTIKDPQNVENNMDNPEDPDVSSTRPVVSKKRKKKSRRGRNTFCSPEEQEMRTELETDSNIENMCMLEDRQQLPPEPPVTPTPDPEPEEPKIEDPQKKPEDPASADGSSTPPGAHKSSKKKSRRGRNKTRFPPMQEISGTLETDSSNKDQCMLLDLSEEPVVTQSPAPVPEEPKIEDPQKKPEDPASADGSSTPPGAHKSSKKKSRRGRNKTRFPPMQEISGTLETDSSNKDQCMLLDLSEEPVVTQSPAPVPECHRLVSSSSKPLLQPATFVFKSPPAFASPEKKKKRRSLKTEDSYIKDLCRKLKRLHLSRKYCDKPKPAPVPQNDLVSSSSEMNGGSPLNRPKPVLKPATFVFKPQPEFVSPEKRRSLKPEDSSFTDLCRKLKRLHLSKRHRDRPKPPLHPASFVFKPPPEFGFAQTDSSVEELCRLLDGLHLS
ncbi:hypothetical protein IRJ41_014530 [Triplophysa rosa]|uniref:Uncharacterized protein n=1 Tax=Triplophysa rosa TaxID=992332 RepID=A0A9W7TCP9_TRIRA|nr:hypothetical protein IRJ41_014530 [Triplophysa rosa]